MTSFRRTATAWMVLLSALTACAVVALVVLTTLLHRAVGTLDAALQSTRMVQRIDGELLSHTRARDPLVRATLESELRTTLMQAERTMSSADERELLARARSSIDRYLSSGDAQGEALEDAFGALRRLGEINLEQATAAQRRASRWDRMANGIAAVVGAILVLGIASAIIWLRRAAFRPVLQIRDAMRDFATGHRGARAPERGAEELRAVAHQFNRMAEALERQHVNRLAFIAGVAHDLRNPLSALKMSTALLSPERALSEERLRSTLQLARRQVDRLDRLVGDLLDASRIEAGQLELRLERHDARYFAREAVELFRPAAEGHELVLKVPDAPVFVECDALRIEQVLNNLVSNAIKYSPSGTRVEIAVERSEGQAVLRVTDEGIGIAPGELARIYEPFRRMGNARDRIPGVGLGLSVARRIVEAHEGEIEVQSQPGAGTTFRVLLPLAETVPLTQPDRAL